MVNSTQVFYFTLSAYIDSGPFRYLYFMIIISLYVLIVGSNLVLIVVICVNRSLHEPMYLFLCSLLFVNELYGSTGLFPFLLIQILSDVHTVSAPLCFLQVFCIHSYVTVEFFNLAVMSYDRYVAICHPLRYNVLMSRRKLSGLIAASWLPPVLLVVIMISLSFSLQLCGNIINKVYCDNYSVVKLACSDTTVNNIYGLISTAFSVFVPVGFILYTYMRILKVCFSGSKQTRQKAVSTCTPHLASLLNFSFGVSFEIIRSRFNMNNISRGLQIFLPLYYLTSQPLFNPFLYGLNLSKIRDTCKKLILRPLRKLN
ncbi:olfactory receptor 11A1-like [Kryptolebias marmoratus]|uniref:olfactory receptor 11A1-like n=1 Tax=Kryptolebias marmoratus TaxID=37003 RepID=UPI0018AC9B3A|nr:olfactory receptor 11A1-like [Kryptolebias marmoratus]